MNRRLWIVGICILVLIAMVVLASSLHDVHFNAGRSLAADARTTSPIPLPVTDTIQAIPLWKLVLLWLVLVINLVLFIWLLPPEVRKRILRQAVSFAIGLLVLLIAIRYRVMTLPFLGLGPTDLADQARIPGAAGTVAPEFHPPQMTSWLIYLISLAVLLILLGLVWVGRRWWARYYSGQHSSLDAIAGIARSSLDEIAEGRDWGDVIVQSYLRMSAVVSIHRGIQRPQAMTPREFAWKLEHAGLPADAVGRLTRLFKSVRYGIHKSTQSEIKEAVACLNLILQACGAAQ